MRQHYLELQQTGQFPKLLIDYLSEKPELRSFYSYYPRLENFKHLIENRKSFAPGKRAELVAVLEEQYRDLPDAPDFSLLLNENTFTVTTGHQLNIFGGPLYIIYKIVTTINLARLLKIAYPDYNFVPVYWMATEDHDFAEIASVHLFGKTFKWEQEAGGAVGALSPKELTTIMDQFPESVSLFERAYSNNDTLADAVRQYMHELFGKSGLVTLDANHPLLKRQFLPVITSELSDIGCSDLVRETSQSLSKMGYDTPVHAREINLFYLRENMRERIVREGDLFRILRTSKRFSQQAILEEAQNYPERFSPNVVLRPLYQETILPNLAYVGGPSEIPYWMQLKAIFESNQTPFPALIPRNFGLYVPSAEQRRMKKLSLEYADLFKSSDVLRKRIVEETAEHSLNLENEKAELKALFDKVSAKAKAVDVTMEAASLAEKTRLMESFSKLEKRLHKAEERKHGILLAQLQKVLDCCFPNGVPQERYANFLDFHLTNRLFLSELFTSFDPLDFRFVILEESVPVMAS
jgi:bacillithiol biosynthesis cysteine-adding enzyme BshC